MNRLKSHDVTIESNKFLYNDSHGTCDGKQKVNEIESWKSFVHYHLVMYTQQFILLLIYYENVSVFFLCHFIWDLLFAFFWWSIFIELFFYRVWHFLVIIHTWHKNRWKIVNLTFQIPHSLSCSFWWLFQKASI